MLEGFSGLGLRAYDVEALRFVYVNGFATKVKRLCSCGLQQLQARFSARYYELLRLLPVEAVSALKAPPCAPNQPLTTCPCMT